jgi:hypothetical protein
MGKQEFKDMLKKIKLDKLLEKVKLQKEIKTKKEKRKFYYIDDYDKQTPIHHLHPDYDQL